MTNPVHLTQPEVTAESLSSAVAELRWIVNGFLEWHEGCPCPEGLFERARAVVPDGGQTVERDGCDPALLGKKIGYHSDGEPFGYITEQELAGALASRGAAASLRKDSPLSDE
jgi:hypothetical protein